MLQGGVWRQQGRGDGDDDAASTACKATRSNLLYHRTVSCHLSTQLCWLVQRCKLNYHTVEVSRELPDSREVQITARIQLMYGAAC